MARNDVFSAVSSPVRRRILDLLRGGERPAGEVGAALPHLPQPAVSRHLRVLREAGLVKVSPSAQRRLYSLEPGRFRELDDWIERYRDFWADRLDQLDRHLERKRAGRQRSRGDPR